MRTPSHRNSGGRRTTYLPHFSDETKQNLKGAYTIMSGTSRANEACSSLLSGRLDAEVIAREMELPVAVLAGSTGQAELRRFCQLWNAVVDLYARNKDHARTFLRAPNRNLEGQAPADLIEKGDLIAVEAFVESMTLRTTT